MSARGSTDATMTLRQTRRTAAPALLLLAGCGALYPRYTTAMLGVPPGLAEGGELSPPPETVHRISLLSAELPRQTRDGRAWDDDGLPDPYVVLFRNGAEVFRSRTLSNTVRPEWDPAHDHADLHVRDSDELRVELRDDDGLGSDPVGLAIQRGVPSDARNGGVWMIRLEGGATVQLRSVAPPPRLGMGVTYEFREDVLVVLAVEQAGPAHAAGLRSGDRIVAIDGRPISVLGDAGARQGMNRATMQDVTLRVARDGRAPMDLLVHRDALYPAH